MIDEPQRKRNDASNGLMSPLTNSPVSPEKIQDSILSFNDAEQSQQAQVPQSGSVLDRLGFGQYGTAVNPSFKNMVASEIHAGSQDTGTGALGNLFPEYGQSRFDKRIEFADQLTDLEDFRAREQSTANKILNGLGQMGVTAATTFADSMLGTIAGVANLATEAAAGNVNSFGDALNAFIENPVSVELQDLNKKGKELFQNYQTELERSRKWYQNIFTANFLADTILGNAGFTVGALYGAKTAATGIAKLAGVSKARDAFKGIVSELGKEAAGKTPSEVLTGIRNGSIRLGSVDATKQLAKSARQLKNSQMGLQLSGALIAGTGEGRIEAINAADELQTMFDETYGDIDVAREQEKAQAKAEMQAASPQSFMLTVGEDGMADAVPSTPEMQQAVDARMKEIDDKYDSLHSEIQHRKAAVANTVFSFNLPLLTFGDAVQFGKFILGDYAVDRLASTGIKSAAKQSMKDAIAKQGLKEGIETTLKAGVELAKQGKRQGLKTAGRALGNALTEMSEEMNQSWISAGSKDYGASKVTEFTERLFNPEAEQKTRTWLDSTREGLKESWGNTDDWVEGFAGFFMGAMGLPSVRLVQRKGDASKKRLKVSMAGGVWEPFRQAREERDTDQATVDAVNRQLQDDKFLTYYHGRIGHEATDLEKAAAAGRGDVWNYDKATQMQFISDVTMFDRVGRLQDLHDMIDRMANVTEDDIPDLRAMTENVKGSDVNKLTDEGLLQRVKDNAEEMQKELEQYEKVSRDIDTVFGGSLTDIQHDELVWKTVRLNLIEDSLKNMQANLQTDLATYLADYRSTHDSVKDLTDYEIFSSLEFADYINKRANEKDTKLTTEQKTKALDTLADFRKGTRERTAYIDILASLSKDPGIIQQRAQRDSEDFKEQERAKKMKSADSIVRSAASLTTIRSMQEDDGSYDSDLLEVVEKAAKDGAPAAQEFLDLQSANSLMQSEIEKQAAKAGLSEEDVAKAKEAWDYVYNNATSMSQAMSPKTAEDIGVEGLTDAQVKLMNDAAAVVSKDGTNAAYIAKVAQEAKNNTNEQGHRVDKSKRLPNGTHRTKVILAPKDNVVDYKSNPVTGTYYIDMARRKIYDRNGYLIVDDENNADTFKLASPSPLADMPFVDVAYEIGLERGKTVFVIKSDVIDPWKETMDAAAPAPQSVQQPQPVPQEPHEETEGSKQEDTRAKYIRAYNTTPAAANVSKGDMIRFGMRSKEGPIYLLRNNDIVGELPVSIEKQLRVTGLYELVKALAAEYSEAGKNADGMFISKRYSTTVRSAYKGLGLTVEDVPIRDIPGRTGAGQLNFVIYTGKNAEYHKSTLSDEEVRKIQWSNNGGPRTGSVYMLLQNSDGTYKPVACQQAVVNSNDWNTIKNTQVGQQIQKAVSTLFEKVVSKRPTADILHAKDDLGKILYLQTPEGSLQFYKRDNAKEVVVKVIHPITRKTVRAYDSADSAEALLNRLLEIGLKIQVNNNPFLAIDRFYDVLVNGGHLTANISSFESEVPGFSMDYFNPDTGTFEEASFGKPAAPKPQTAPEVKDGGKTMTPAPTAQVTWSIDCFSLSVGDKGIKASDGSASYTWDEAVKSLGLDTVTGLFARAAAQEDGYRNANGPMSKDNKHLFILPNGELVGYDRTTDTIMSVDDTDLLYRELQYKSSDSQQTPASSQDETTFDNDDEVDEVGFSGTPSSAVEAARGAVQDLDAIMDDMPDAPPVSEAPSQQHSKLSAREQERLSDCGNK